MLDGFLYTFYSISPIAHYSFATNLSFLWEIHLNFESSWSHQERIEMRLKLGQTAHSPGHVDWFRHRNNLDSFLGFSCSCNLKRHSRLAIFAKLVEYQSNISWTSCLPGKGCNERRNETVYRLERHSPILPWYFYLNEEWNFSVFVCLRPFPKQIFVHGIAHWWKILPQNPMRIITMTMIIISFCCKLNGLAYAKCLSYTVSSFTK